MKERLRVLGKVVPYALFMLGLAAGVIWILSQFAADETELQRQATEITALQAGLDEANARLEAQGEEPVPVPEVEPGADPPAPQIIIGEPGPEGDRGPAGVRGPQGRTGPPGEIGPRGPVGPRGEHGEDSKVPGPAGINGLNGADGRGIQSMQCAAGGWIIKYTDGLAAPDPGPCQGPQGPQGVHGEQGPQGIQGEQGTAKPGDYDCPDDQHMTGFTIAADGTVALACEDATPPVTLTP
jgi:hypothetical protein